MKKLFTFAQLERPNEVEAIYVWYIGFDGSHSVKYNAPTWEGTFELPCEDDFFISSICDGGGYVEIKYKDGTKIEIKPICTMCGSTNMVGKSFKIEGSYRFYHKCQDCNNLM